MNVYMYAANIFWKDIQKNTGHLQGGSGEVFSQYTILLLFFISNLGTSSASLSLTSYPSEKVAMQILGWFQEPLDFNTHTHH